MTGPIDDDPRWSLISGQQSKCPCCGEDSATLLSLAYDRPDPFPSDAPGHQNAMLNATDGDILTEDFCRMGEYRFVRCVLEFPLRGLDDDLVLGVWGSLSVGNFGKYVDRFDSGDQAELGDMFSWLMNAVPRDRRQPVKMVMVPRDGRQRPQLYFSDEADLMYPLQQNGLSYDELADLLQGYGHDLRAKNRLN
ncbi:DUF2199 domain-containing protein [Cognatiyoonia sp. IB215182]|uniref:DUF2199 domain-containing protein n=1 Tax=Cognatiyoonia sp. IB215182 TaxID=3097353 RepID=UPI002A17E523|nr:DUF2199 domain-containing protein [Cognatiyoonia sp. IB215182]MDX8353260.1 DUF2199 domain-containing protein [Cognatiyoonia sp. IB215182]